MLWGGTLTSLLVAAVVMADTVIAGMVLGENGVAGVNLVMPIYSLASFFALLFSLGIPIMYSNLLGAFKKEEADKAFGTGLLMTVCIGGALFLLLLLFGKTYLRFYYAPPEIYELADDYLKWMKYVVLLTPVNALVSGMVFADGDDVISAVSNIISGVGNIVLSVFLCRAMGIEGLGLASFISLAVSFGSLFIHFAKKSNSLRLNLSFSAENVKNTVKYSIVDSSTYLFIAVFTYCCNRIVLHFFGPKWLFVAAIITFIKELQILFDGIGSAISPLISLYLGEGTYDGVREIWDHAKRTSVIESVIVTGPTIILAPLIVRIIGITDHGPALIAANELRILSLTLFFTCRMYLDSSYYIIADRIPLGVFVCALRDISISLPLALLGAFFGGIEGMAIGVTAAQPIGYLLSVAYVWKRYGKENYPLFIAENERTKRALFYELDISPDNIVSVRDNIGKDLKEKGFKNETVNRIMLLVEETLMLIFENNPKKKVLAECSVLLGDKLILVIKDDGVLFDLTDSDMAPTSLRRYVISNMAEKISDKRRHFLALSYNRNMFEIRQDRS